MRSLLLLIVGLGILLLVVGLIKNTRPKHELTPVATTPTHIPRSPGSYTEIFTTSDGMERTYLLHIPKTYEPDKTYPLLLSFHGTYGDGESQEKLSGFSEIADTEGFIVVYPNGLYKEWNDGRGDSRAEKEGVDDVLFVSELIKHIAASVSIDQKRIFATGMSNGSSFSHRLACELGNTISGIGAVGSHIGATFASTCNPIKPIPVIIFHGTSDPINPYRGGKGSKGATLLGAEEAAAFWARKNNCSSDPISEEIPDTVSDNTSVTRTIYSPCEEKSAVVLYTIHGGGHTWPGGWQYLPTRIVGQTTGNADASKLMWKFFSSQSSD